MSWWSRIANVFRSGRLDREIDEEFASHMEEAIASGRDAKEARRAFGSALRHRESSRDMRLAVWLDSLRADSIFGWRQLWKRKASSIAAILSLGLAIGACTSAFRLIDALLLRPLPVAHPESLYHLSRVARGFNAKALAYDEWAYPDFRLMRTAVRGQAELIAVSYAERSDLTYRSDAEMEKAQVQYVSGWMFDSFGLKPALGRLLSENDDRTPRAHAYAVVSYDYWTRRFARNPNILGSRFRMGEDVYEIAGVVAPGFTGTEPGIFTDVFVPTMMYPLVTRNDASWHRTFVRVYPGVAIEPLRQKLDAATNAFEAERAKGFMGMPKASRDMFLNQKLLMEPAGAGASGLQQDYRRTLAALAVLVGLVLLIACANVANLLAAQAADRAREMALRVSIGAGRRRLAQLVMVESGWLALFAALTGAFFAWWSAPFVVSRINAADNPARIALPADWRVLLFGMGLTVVVTILFGLAPALRASAMRPATALKDGDDPHSRRRLMYALAAAQVAFCFVVIFVAGLFAASFRHIAQRPTGFSTDRLLAIDTVSRQPQPVAYWDQMAEHLRHSPRVEKVAIAGWALPGGNSTNSFLSINGAPVGPVLTYFLPVSPGWLGTMKLPLVAGRDFRDTDVSPGFAIVNETFVKQFLSNVSPIGKFFLMGKDRFDIVGVAVDAPYRNVREPMLPVAYIPFHWRTKEGGFAPKAAETFMVRTTAANPLSLASFLRLEISSFQPEFRVTNIRTQAELVEAQTVRDRLLAMLALFFAAIALLLAAMGLYGVLDYSVLQRRREIGIRRAVGAQSAGIAWLVGASVLGAIFAGATVGLGFGIALAGSLESLLYQVNLADWTLFAAPVITIGMSAAIAAFPGVVRAIRIDPARMLRAE